MVLSICRLLQCDTLIPFVVLTTFQANFDIQLTEVEVDDFSATEPTLEIEEDENSAMIYLHSQSPREVSSRVSQLSSLLHSHRLIRKQNEFPLFMQDITTDSFTQIIF